jgi:septal ring factor EnvC (AmiA/AmiB activator)
MQKSQMIFGNTCKPTEAADRLSRLSTQAFLEFQSKLEQVKDNVKAQIAQLEALAQIRARNDAEIDKLKRKREETGLEEQVARRAGGDALAALERARLEEQERKRQEAQVQASLRQMGVFCMGYIWIKQSSCTDVRAAVTSSPMRNSVYEQQIEKELRVCPDRRICRRG